MIRLAELRAAGNPVHPYEWAVYYIGNHVVHRRDGVTTRIAAWLPTFGVVRMQINGPGLARLDIMPLPNHPIDVIVTRTLVLHRPDEDLIMGWRFGFKQGDLFTGALVNRRGIARLVSQPWSA